MDGFVGDSSCLESGRSRIQDIDVHLDEERGEFLQKTFIHKSIHRYLDCGSWIRAQELSLSHHHVGIWWQDFEHLELNEVGRGKPTHDHSSILCTDMHSKYV